MSKKMTVKTDLSCIFNMPAKIESEFESEEEMAHSLPPYAPIDAYPVDEYDSCPDDWMNGSDDASSYFLGVKEDNGMWLDFNECFYHTHDVAVVISIQGINPITGQKMVAEKALRLEQYHKKCPIHNVSFKQDRFCDKCGFKWPGQNYLSTTGTPEFKMWLDGFRSSDGKVRQYIITEDKMRGVASQIIGNDRVFAIGIAYYLSKNKKPYLLQRPEVRSSNPHHDGVPPAYCGPGIDATMTQPMFFSPLHTPKNWSVKGGSYSCSSSSCSSSSSVKNSMNSLRMSKGVQISVNSVKSQCSPVVPVKKLEIGAGALIKQRVYDDPKMMDYWEEKPAGMIYINYCDEETKKKIIAGGRRADEKDGFLKDVKVGG